MKTRFYVIALIALFLCNITVSAQKRNPNRMVFHKDNRVIKTYSVEEVDDITFEYVENKEVGISVVNVESNSCKVSFTMPDNCSSYYVGVIPADSKEDFTQYVQTHNSAKFTESKEYTFENLKAGVEYYILALPIDKYGLSTILSKQKVKTVSNEYKNRASTFFDVDYWADAFMNGYQNFVIRLGDCPHDGVYPKGNGRIYHFSIYCKTADGTINPMPQPGTYSYYTGDTPIDMCMDDDESMLTEYYEYESDKNYKNKDVKYNDATLTITKNGDGTYTVKALIQQADGELVALTYTGNFAYRDKSFKGYTGPNLDRDIEFTCDHASPYDLDGICFEIMDGGDPYAEGASWYKRNRVMIFMSDDGHGMPRVGTFPVTEDGSNGTVRKGCYKNFGGGAKGSDGTRYEYVESPIDESTFGFVESGSITISKDTATGNYTISTDFITDKGKSIKATYTGPFKSNGKTPAGKQWVARLQPVLGK